MTVLRCFSCTGLLVRSGFPFYFFLRSSCYRCLPLSSSGFCLFYSILETFFLSRKRMPTRIHNLREKRRHEIKWELKNMSSQWKPKDLFPRSLSEISRALPSTPLIIIFYFLHSRTGTKWSLMLFRSAPVSNTIRTRTLFGLPPGIWMWRETVHGWDLAYTEKYSLATTYSTNKLTIRQESTLENDRIR